MRGKVVTGRWALIPLPMTQYGMGPHGITPCFLTVDLLPQGAPAEPVWQRVLRQATPSAVEGHFDLKGCLPHGVLPHLGTTRFCPADFTASITLPNGAYLQAQILDTDDESDNEEMVEIASKVMMGTFRPRGADEAPGEP